uniref:B3 domain-containing protein At3g25182-like n=1 Tax=Erigeron canadensis TaxID=72917 RepID=UPI001CB9D4DF|nr:B3 domain-containing protein At3g25182-like [Erigeron canadensis]
MGRTKPPRLDGESEDDYYMRLIQKLANEKLALFARYQMEQQQEEEERKEVATNLLSLKKSKKSSLKRKQRDFDEDDVIDIKIKNKKKKKVGVTTTNKAEQRPVVVNKVTEGVKEFIKNKMKGSDLKLLIQKTLYASDLNPGQNRLNMPANQLETNANDFLTADEMRKLTDKDKKSGLEVDKDKKSGVEVGILGPNLRMYDRMLELKIWDMPCTKNYVLISNWYNFVKEHYNFLKKGTLIQVWAFRLNEQLCLALVCPDHEDDNVAFEENLHDGENDDVAVAASASEV